MWRYEFDGEQWTHEDLTGGEIVALEKELGVPFIELRPGASMQHRLAVLASFLTRNRDEAEVRKVLEEAPLRQLHEWVRWVDEEPGEADHDRPTSYEDGLPLPEAAPTG